MPKIKGGKLKAKEIKDFLQASYEKKPPDELDGYILDKSLSNATAKVYYNPQTNHAVVAHRGTKGALDWGNNLAYALGAYEYTPRYKQGKSVQDKAEKKYGKSNISTLGHSQGSILARKLGTDTQEVINVNPAYSGERPAKNEYNIRSSSDIVSGLYAPVAKTREYLFPKYSEKHDITIPSKSATDILGEHSYSILDRLGDKEIGVGAGNKISSNYIMKGGRTHRLGYSFDDIDFIGGTNNNCGAVGTAHINRGYTPIGVIGGYREDTSSSDSESESDSDEEMEGGKIKNPFKKVGKAFDKVGKAFEPVGNALAKGAEYANPMMWALKDKNTSEAMAKSGEITHDYLLPAVVSAGKPIYDATAMTASTMLTGNPVLGKVVADTLWNEMVAKPGNDPRQYQKSKELGELSGTFGQAVSKPFSASLGGYRLKAGMEGGTRTIWEKLYDIVNPPDSFEAWRERNQHRRISKALKERIEAEHQALLMRQRADAMERGAREKEARDIKSAKDYGVFEEITPEEAERETMAVEDIGSKHLGTEGKIEKEDPEWAMEGNGRQIDFEDVKWGTFTRMFKEFKKENPRARVKDLEAFAHRIIKNKSKFSPKALKKAQFYLNVIKKGGASPAQIGMANAMRTFTAPDNTTYYALSDLSHSADNPENPGVKDYSAVFRNLNTKDPDPRASEFLRALAPSYYRQKYYIVEKMMREGKLDPAEGMPILQQLLETDADADKMIRGYNNDWGVSNPLVRRIYHEVEAVNPKAQQAKIRRERKYTHKGRKS